MPKIKVLEDCCYSKLNTRHNLSKGSCVEVDDFTANGLIARNHAELSKSTPKPVKSEEVKPKEKPEVKKAPKNKKLKGPSEKKK